MKYKLAHSTSGLLLIMLIGCGVAQAAGELKVYNWGEYIAERREQHRPGP